MTLIFRLESATLVTTSNNQRRYEQTVNKKDGSPHVVLRSRNELIKSEYRLSVPNLNEMAAAADNAVANSAKALTSKIGRNPGTGELQVRFVLMLYIVLILKRGKQKNKLLLIKVCF